MIIIGCYWFVLFVLVEIYWYLVGNGYWFVLVIIDWYWLFFVVIGGYWLLLVVIG